MRFHGRGGQGAVMGAEILAHAFVIEGKYASSFPSFGVERRGAPVTAFLRCDERPIRDTHQVYEPECVVILDPSFAQAKGPLEGLQGDGILIVNTPKTLRNYYAGYGQVKLVGLVDATGVALSEIGKPISNTCMLGAIARATEWVKLGSVISSLERYFQGEILKRNVSAARRGYEELDLFPLKRLQEEIYAVSK